MRALQIRRSAAKFGMARIASAVAPATAARIGPLEYRSIDDPEYPGEGWHRVQSRLAGICGSDLSLVEGHASTYFDDYVSFPFVPGHEVVGELDDGRRVVLEPVLGHAARGVAPPFDGAAPGDGDDYAHLAVPSRDGRIEPGIQTGFCCSTGGGWAPWFWAHESQLHRVARRDARRTRRADRADRRRHPRRVARLADHRWGRRPGRRGARGRHDGARCDCRPQAVPPGRAHRRRRPLPAPDGTRQAARRRRRRAGCQARPSGPARGRLPSDRRHAELGCPRHHRRGRERGIDHRLPCASPARAVASCCWACRPTCNST